MPEGSAPSQSVCCRCPCFCDDIRLQADASRLASADGACPLGKDWLESLSDLKVRCQQAGKEIPVETAIAAAAERLSRARAPEFLLGSGLSVEAARAFVPLAQLLSASVRRIHPRALAEERAGLDAPQFAASFGEVRNADLVVFWRWDPRLAAPRFVERYTRADARLLIIDDPSPTPASSSKVSDREIIEVSIGADEDLSLLQEIAARRRNTTVSPGLDDDKNRAIDAICGAEHVHFFLGGDALTVAALDNLLGRLAAQERNSWRATFSLAPSSGSPRSASEVLTWQTGGDAPLQFRGEGHRPLQLTEQVTPQSTSDVSDLRVAIGCVFDESPENIDISIGDRFVGSDIEFRSPLLDPRLDATVIRSDGVSLTLAGRSTSGATGPSADPIIEVFKRLLELVSEERRAGSNPNGETP